MDDIHNWADSKERNSGKSAVFAIFYQDFCHPCRDDMPIWNEAIEKIKVLFPDLAAFVKIDL